MILLFVATEITVISGLITELNGESIGLAVLLQIPAFIALLFSTSLKSYRNRKLFTIYFARLEDVDISFIKANYAVHFIDTYGVVFTNSEDIDLWHDFSLFTKINYSKDVEEQLFGNSEEIEKSEKNLYLIEFGYDTGYEFRSDSALIKAENDKIAIDNLRKFINSKGRDYFLSEKDISLVMLVKEEFIFTRKSGYDCEI